MSIILKGIDMPKEGELRLIISKNGMICGAEYPKVRHAYPLNLDAEAIQIPTPHGRMIDGGELYKDFENHCGGECDCCVHETENYNCGLIANAPTILEAED